MCSYALNEHIMINILCVLGSETKKSDGKISRLIKSKNLNQDEKNMKHKSVMLNCVNRT